MGLPHISSLYSESWVAWLVFALVVIALSNPFVRMVGVTWHGVFSQSERAYTPQTHDWLSEITLRIFQLGVATIGMLMWILPHGDVEPILFAQALGIVTAVYVVQSLLTFAVGHVFVSAKRFGIAWTQHNNIRTLMCIGIYPVLLLLLNTTASMVPQILCGIIVVLFVMLLAGKCLQLFYAGPLSILYVLLYVVCLEILPLGMCVFLIKHIM